MGDGQADTEPRGQKHGHGAGSGSALLWPQLILYPRAKHPHHPVCTRLPRGGRVPLWVGGAVEQEREKKMQRSCSPPSSPERDSSIWERKGINGKELEDEKEM